MTHDCVVRHDYHALCVNKLRQQLPSLLDNLRFTSESQNSPVLPRHSRALHTRYARSPTSLPKYWRNSSREIWPDASASIFLNSSCASSAPHSPAACPSRVCAEGEKGIARSDGSERGGKRQAGAQRGGSVCAVPRGREPPPNYYHSSSHTQGSAPGRQTVIKPACYRTVPRATPHCFDPGPSCRTAQWPQRAA